MHEVDQRVGPSSMDGDTLIQFDLERADRVLEGHCEIARKGRGDQFARPCWLDGEIGNVSDELMQFASRLVPDAVRFRVELCQQLLPRFAWEDRAPLPPP